VKWGTNITYWRANSLPLGYQNQSTAWVFGGDNVTFQGHGTGTFDGNGQLWFVSQIVETDKQMFRH
jgi:galacturan 1,4-alpha-galacturonidase